MRVPRWRRGLAVLLFAFALSLSAGARACADTIASTFSPIIFVNMPSGNVMIRTWDRQGVEITGDQTVQYKHTGALAVQRRLAQQPIQPELWAQTVQTPDGPLSLAPEQFPLPPLSPGLHDAVSVRGSGGATITVPAGTALIVANVRQGSVNIDGYHGVFVSHVVVGSVRLTGVSGTGAVQVNNGEFTADDSQFDRLRVRTGRGNMYFDGCASSQIQASSLLGTIVYDRGTFTPGLAHFESERGTVALGVTDGNAQITAHSDAGRVMYDGREFMRGGPVVTATSGTGAVLYYHGAIANHPRLLRELPPNARPYARPRDGRPPDRP